MTYDKDNPLFQNKFIQDLGYETPFFLFSKEKIVENLERYKKCFPGANIYYAMKANFEPPILEVLFKAGANFEVASKFELSLIKDLGVPPEKIMYGSAIKPADHIEDFYDYGVRIFACDYGPELEKIAKHAPGSKVYFRLSVDNEKSSIPLSEKFGASKASIVELIDHAEDLGLEPYGISFHVGSQSKDVDSWANNLERVKDVLDAAKEKGTNLKIINIGGGYPCKYLSSGDHITLEEIASKTLKKKKELGITQQFVLEPGRGMIADTGVIVTSVIGKTVRGDKTWLFMDAGVYTGMFESMAYQGSTRYKITSLNGDHGVEVQKYSIAGPTGDGPDVIDRDVDLPKGIDVGDKLLIHDIGAYSLPTVCAFHAFPKPCVYLV